MRYRLRGQVARQQKGAVGLEQEPVCRDFTHQRQQMSAAPLVADPAGNADGQTHVEVGRELFARAGKTVSDTAGESVAMLAKNGYEVRMRVALMKKDRLADEAGELQLPMEGLLLDSARREVAKIIESAFAHRDHLRKGCELAQLRQQFARELFRIVRMNTRRRKEVAGVSARQFDRVMRAGTVAAGDDHLDHAGLRRPCNHSVTIIIEAVVSEIDADIYQGTGYHV